MLSFMLPKQDVIIYTEVHKNFIHLGSHREAFSTHYILMKFH